MDPRILLIEDNSDDVLLIKRAFRQIYPTIKVDVLTNGEEAIAYLNGDREFSDRRKFPLPDLILLDLKIPRKSGLEVLAWIWDQPDLERLRVIVLTSSQCGKDIEQAFDLDAESYLVKPNTFDELLELVRRIDLSALKADKRRRAAARLAAAGVS